MSAEPTLGGNAEFRQKLRSHRSTGAGAGGTVFGVQQPEEDLGVGLQCEVGQRLPVGPLCPRRDGRGLDRIDSPLHVPGQSVGQGHDRGSVARQDVPAAAGGCLLVRWVTHEWRRPEFRVAVAQMEGELGVVVHPVREAGGGGEDRLNPTVGVGEPALDCRQFGRQIPLDGQVARRDHLLQRIDAAPQLLFVRVRDLDLGVELHERVHRVEWSWDGYQKA